MELKKNLELAQTWCLENNIPVFKGVADSPIMKVTWTDQTDLSGFLEIALSIKVDLLNIHSSFFDPEDVLPNLAEIEPEDPNSELGELYKFLNEKKGELEFISISWVKDLSVYSFFQVSEWFDKIKRFEELVEEDKKPSLGFNNNLTEDQIEILSTEIAKHKNFLIWSTRQDKLDIIFDEILENSGIDVQLNFFDRNRINQDSKKYFNKHFREDQERILIQQINDMKSEGNSKKKIRSVLDITQGMLDRYYFQGT